MLAQNTNPDPEEENGERDPRRRGLKWFFGKVAVPVLVASIPVVGLVLSSNAAPQPLRTTQTTPSASTTPSGGPGMFTASFTYPEGGSVISTYPSSDPIRGALHGSPDRGSSLWVVVQASGEVNWHPFRAPCQLVSDGFTCQNLYLGKRNQHSGTFRLELLLAGASQTASLEAWAERGAGDNTAFPLPRGVRVLDSITISRE